MAGHPHRVNVMAPAHEKRELRHAEGLAGKRRAMVEFQAKMRPSGL